MVFSAANMNYQIQNLPSRGCVISEVPNGRAVGSWPMTFSQDTTINFKPSGFVTATVGSNVFTITYQLERLATITVSNYGNVLHHVAMNA